MPSPHSIARQKNRGVLDIPIPYTIGLGMFLVSDAVQRISFDFGGFLVLPQDFRRLADKLLDPKQPMTVRIDPDFLNARGALGAYDNSKNRFYFMNSGCVSEPRWQGVSAHEAVHAVADMRAKRTGRIEEEAACFLTESMFHVSNETDVDFWNWLIEPEIFDVAEAVYGRSRRQAGPVEVTLGERLKVRRAVRKGRGYKLGWDRDKDGIS